MLLSSLSSNAASFQSAFICDTRKADNETLHELMAENIISALAQGVQMYRLVLNQHPECYQRIVELKNIKLIKEKGKLITVAEGLSFYTFPLGEFVTMGVFGRDD